MRGYPGSASAIQKENRLMGLLGEMTVRFGADTSGLSAGVSVAKNMISSIASGNWGQAAATGLVAIGAAAVGFAAASVSAAADFQQSMLKVQAYAGLTKTQADAMSHSILQMAVQVGQSPKALADALYPIVSAGYNASDALNILRLSAETAAASGAKTSVVADGLTTTLKAFGLGANQAQYAMDVLNKTTAVGKMEFPALAAVIGKLSLTASAAHVPFTSMNAALAELTTHGFPSVAQASTALGNLFTNMDIKVDGVAQKAKKMGLSFDEQKFKTMTLAQQIAYLNDVTGGNQAEILKLLSGSTNALKAFNALRTGASDYANNLKQLDNAQGTTAQVFATASQGYNFQVQRMQAAFQVLLVTVGSALLPALTRIMSAVSPAITSFAAWLTQTNALQNGMQTVGAVITTVFTIIAGIVHTIQQLTSFFQQNHDAAALLLIPLGALGGVLTYLAVTAIAALIASIPALVAGFIAGAAAAWTMAAGVIAATWPFILAGVVIAAVVVLIILAINHWGAIVNWLKGVWGGISAWFQALLKQVEQPFINIGNWFKDRFNDAANGVKTGVDKAKSFFSGIGDWFKQNAQKAGDGAKTGLQSLQQAWTTTTTNVGNAMIWLYNHNTYVKELVDTVVADFNLAKAWIISIWTEITSWLSSAWATIKAAAILEFNTISTSIQNALTTVRNIVQTVISFIVEIFTIDFDLIRSIVFAFIVSYITSQLNTVRNGVTTVINDVKSVFTTGLNILQTIATNAWNAVSRVFSSAYNTYIAPPLNSLISSIKTLWNSFVSGAETMGADLINAIASGISGAAGAVGNAIHSAIGGALSSLGFHNIPGFAGGVQNFGGGWAIVGEKGPELVQLPRGASVYPNGTGPMGGSGGGAVSSGGSGAGPDGGNQTIYVMLDGGVLMQAVASRQASTVQIAHSRRAA
jgi:TP901 family phage tail tape measure protein